MSTLHLAVVGCGRIAGHHARSIVSTAGLKLVAVCDLIDEKAQAYAKEFSVAGFTNYRQMLEQHPEIDVVALCTPSGMHFEHAAEFISKFKKHVIVEKPTFLKLSQMNHIEKLATENSVQIFPVFQNRYNKAVQRVKIALIQNELGDPRVFSVRVRWCRPQRYYDLSAWRGTFAMDGGAITNQGVHHIDLLRYLGGEVTEVSSVMTTLGADIEVEDTCVATLKFKSGAVGSLEITTSARPDDYEASISILGSKGLAQIGGIAVNELQILTTDPAATSTASEDFSRNVYGHGHKVIYSELVRHFENKQTDLITFQEARKSIELLHSFYVSSEKNMRVNPQERYESVQLGREDQGLADLYRIPGGVL